MATIIKTIDEEGFEEAARYVKEPKQGVRSIAARGNRICVQIRPNCRQRSKKDLKPYQDPKFKDLSVWYVMNNVVQMPTGKFNNLYDSITLFLDPEFSTDKAVKHILGRFNPDAKRSSEYFVKEMAKAIMEEQTVKYFAISLLIGGLTIANDLNFSFLQSKWPRSL